MVGQRHALGFPGRAGSEHQNGFVRACRRVQPQFFNHEPRCQEFDGEAPAFGGTFKQGNFPLHEDQIPLRGPREILELSHEGIRSDKPVHAGLLYRAGKGSFRGGIIEIHRCFPGEQAAQIGYGRSLARRKNDADPAVRGNFFQPLGKGYRNGQQLAVSQRSVVNAVDDPAIGMKFEAAEKEGGQGTVELRQRGVCLGGTFQPRGGQARRHLGPGSQFGENMYLDVRLGVRIGLRIQHGVRVKTGIDRYGGDMQGFQGLDDPRRNLADGTFHMGDGTGQKYYSSAFVNAFHDGGTQRDRVAASGLEQDAVRFSGFQMGGGGRIRGEAFFHQVGHAVPAQFFFEHQ